MSKSTYFAGQPVYSQVIKLLDKAKIQQFSLETIGSERYVKRLTGWKYLIIMLFGILKHFGSLRELEIGMKAETMKLSHLGLDYVVRRSTLAEANLRRLQEFLAKVYASLLERYTLFADNTLIFGGLLFEKESPKSYSKGLREAFVCRLEVYQTAIIFLFIAVW